MCGDAETRTHSINSAQSSHGTQESEQQVQCAVAAASARWGRHRGRKRLALPCLARALEFRAVVLHPSDRNARIDSHHVGRRQVAVVDRAVAGGGAARSCLDWPQRQVLVADAGSPSSSANLQTLSRALVESVGKLQSALLEAVEVEGEVEIDARIAPPRSRSERVPAYTAAPERRVGPASRPQRRLPAGRIGRPRADRSLVQGGRATSQRCAPSPRRGESGSGRNHRPTVQTLLIHAGG